jgi:serine/threonine protein kinase/WD40 repeat protein
VDTADDVTPDPLADPRVFQAIQDYQTEVDAGYRPDHAEFVSRYPYVAEALAGCLRGFDFLRAAAPRATHHGTPECGTAGALATESRLGDFRILREVGRGGMGVVYQAEQLSLGRLVALKVVSAPALDDRARQRFRNEAHAAASLHHPHIVPVYAVGADGDALFLAMQFITGRSLAALVRQLQHPTGPSAATPADTAADTGPYTPAPTAEPVGKGEPLLFPTPPAAEYYRAAARLTAEAAEALQHAHDFGIVHRDVKPGNLLVEPNGHLWVADFGLARLPGSADLTRTGEMLGTLRYMSPEQAAGGTGVDHRTDVYSLGATLYELLTLRPAFPGSGPHDVLRRIASEEPPAPRSIAVSIPRDLETVVLKAMTKEPAERYPTAQALAAELKRFLEDRPVLARRPTLAHRLRKWTSRNRRLVTAATAVAFLFLASAVVGLALTADRIRVEQGKTEKVNEELTRTVGELGETVKQRDGAIGKLNQTVSERDAAITDLNTSNTGRTVALRQEERTSYLYRFSAAWREYVSGHWFQARELLDASPAAHRGWEWTYLDAVCRPGEFRSFVIPPGGGSARALSPDGRLLAGQTADGVTVWDTRTGQTVRTFPAPAFHRAVLEFSPDTRHLAYAQPTLQAPVGKAVPTRLTAECRLVDLETGRDVVLFEKEKYLAVAVAIDPHGRLVAAVCGDTRVRFWTIPDGKPFGEIPAAKPIATAPLVQVAFHPGGASVAVADTAGAIWEWEAATGKKRRIVPGDGKRVRNLTFSRDGRLLLWTTADLVVRVWNLAGVREQVTFDQHTRDAGKPSFGDGRGLALHPTAGLVATALGDGTVRVWEAETGKEVRVFRERMRGIRDLAYGPDGRWLAALTAGGVNTWEVEPRSVAPDRTTLPGRRYGRYSPDGRRLAILSDDGSAMLVRDLRSGRETHRLAIDPGHVPKLIDFDDRGRFLTYHLSVPAKVLGPVIPPGTQVAWDLDTGRKVAEFPKVPPGHHVFAPDGSVHAFDGATRGSPRGYVVRETASGRTVQTFDEAAPGGVGVFGPGPAGVRLAYATGDFAVTVRDVATGAVVHRLTGHAARVDALRFSPRGDRLASGDADGVVRVWDLTDGRSLLTFDRHTSAVGAVGWSTDGRRVASGGTDRTVRVWDADTGQELLAFTNIPGDPARLTFTPDGRQLTAHTHLEDFVIWGPAPDRDPL